MRKVLPLLLCILFMYNARLFSQNKLLADSTYLSIQKIKNDSVRHSKGVNYMSALMVRKDTKGIVYSEMLLKDATAAGDQKYLATVYEVMADGYMRTGEYAQAYPIYLKALPLLQKVNLPTLLVRTYESMAWIQVQLKDDGAEATLQSALKYTKEHNLKSLESEVYATLGVVYDSHDQFDNAIASYKTMLAFDDKYTNAYSRTSAYMNLGISYRRSKHYNEALESFMKAKTQAEIVKDKYLFQSLYQNLAELTLEMKDYDGAEKYVLLALANSKDNYEAVTRRGLFENLKNIYEKKGEYKKALAYDDSVIVTDKKTFDKDKTASVRELQTKYETAVKDQKIQQQNAENLRQKQLLVINQKQAQIQQINFINKQKQFETDHKLEASLLQKNTLQAKLDKQLSSAQIFKQNETIRVNNRMQAFLLAIVLAAFTITGLIFYNQRKTKRLNSVILAQKSDLENVNSVKDRMFSVIGHDMRSPINTLMAFNSLLEHEELSATQMKLYSNEIKKTLDSTASMMNNLLNWASSQMQGYQPNLQDHQLKGISELVVNAVQAQAAQKGITIRNNVPASISIFADNNMTELILRNLITNAIKFTPKNGIITINAEQDANETRFSVTDSGIGLSPELLSLFNSKKLNYTVKSTAGTNKEKGTGLGLLLCKTFADLMNGSIAAYSNPGEGSTFNVRLPVA